VSHTDLPLTVNVISALHERAQRSPVDALNVVAALLDDAKGATHQRRDGLLHVAHSIATRAVERAAKARTHREDEDAGVYEAT
jgi:hypothetical protein